MSKKVVIFSGENKQGWHKKDRQVFQEKNRGVTPSVAVPGVTHHSDATASCDKSQIFNFVLNLTHFCLRIFHNIRNNLTWNVYIGSLITVSYCNTWLIKSLRLHLHANCEAAAVLPQCVLLVELSVLESCTEVASFPATFPPDPPPPIAIGTDNCTSLVQTVRSYLCCCRISCLQTL